MSLAMELPDGASLVEVRVSGDEVTVGDEVLRVEVLDDHTVRVHRDGRSVAAFVARDADTIWVAVAGQTWRFPRPDRPRPRRRTGAVDGAQTVSPPMPGQVIKIDVAVGDSVEKGQIVAVVSAMKMETPLKAPYSGTVTAIHVEAGAQVNAGDVLVEIARDE